MSTIVPYYGFRRGITGLARYSSFAPRLGRVLYNSYRYRRRIGRVRQAVSIGGKLYRRRSVFKRAIRGMKRKRLEGAPSTNTQSRKYQFGGNTTFDVLERKTLAGSPLALIDAPGDNDNMRQAPQTRFFCSGIKLCCTFRNVTNVPIHVHMAIVQPKEEQVNLTGIKSDMFVTATTTERYTSFVDFSSLPTWSRTQDCSSLNKRKYNIFTHQRFILTGNSNTADTRNSGNSWRHFEKYYKINKTFEFLDNNAATVYKPMWLLIWYETVFPTAASINALEYNINTKASIRKK